MSIKEQEEQLSLKGQMLQATCNWWAREIQLKMSRFTFLQEKLVEKWDDKMFQECNELQIAITQLQKKCEWEKKENDKFTQEHDRFVKSKEKDIKKTLSAKLTARLRQNQI